MTFASRGKLPTSPNSAPAAESRMATDGSRRRGAAGFTLVEVMVATAVLLLCGIAVTQSLLQLNRQAAIARIMNAAKAEVLSRIQEVSQCSYDPDAWPAVIPSILATGTTVEATVDLGRSLPDLGVITGTPTRTVTKIAGTHEILSVHYNITFKYLGRNLSYELFTYKSPD